MTANEALTFYLEQKQSNQMSKTDIRKALENDFSPADADAIFNAILDSELIAVQSQKSTLVKILESKTISYLFIVFGLIVIVTSIYFITMEQTELNKYLPWLMIFGAALIITKHISNIRRN